MTPERARTTSVAGWFDSHVHLDRYAVPERSGLLRRARRAGVAGMLTVSTDLASSLATIRLRSPVLKAVGVHPLRAAMPAATFDRLASAPGVVAIGEVGFDEAGPALETQAGVFRGMCDLARRHDLALVLHVVGCWEWFVREAVVMEGLRVVRHYFTGDELQADWHAGQRHVLSFGRPLLREPRLQAIAGWYPADLLQIETDSYPLPRRSTEPRELPTIGAALAASRGWTTAECSAQLRRNAVALFGAVGEHPLVGSSPDGV